MKITWVAKSGWRCASDGPHGPIACGVDHEHDERCMCGCDDYYNACEMNMEFWEKLQKQYQNDRGI